MSVLHSSERRPVTISWHPAPLTQLQFNRWVSFGSCSFSCFLFSPFFSLPLTHSFFHFKSFSDPFILFSHSALSLCPPVAHNIYYTSSHPSPWSVWFLSSGLLGLPKSHWSTPRIDIRWVQSGGGQQPSSLVHRLDIN